MALGSRIRKIRKEQKMTLVDLAGDQITKGMLSLIENEKSKPSMETLEYLAGKLNVSIGYLTHEGDEEWTRKMIESGIFYNTYTFPAEFVEENILPNLDKIASSQTGMSLYHMVRVYYRYTGQPKLAEQITEKVVSFYEQMGLKNLALKDKVNDALSMLYSREYKKGYEKFISLEEEIGRYKQFDSGLELDYLHWRSAFAIEFDQHDFLEYGTRLIAQSFKSENFKYYFMQNVLFAFYYGTVGDMDKYGKYNDNIKRYLNFNPDSYYSLEIINEDRSIQTRYILIDNSQSHVKNMEKYRERVIKNESEDDPKYQENYRNMLKMLNFEYNYHKGNYEYVAENFDMNIYDRPGAQFPLDRILIATRSSVYPMSLFKLGRVDEARKILERIEVSITDIKDSLFTKEFFEIKNIIFDGK